MLPVMGCTVTSPCSIKRWYPHAAHFLMITRDVKQWDRIGQNHSLCFTVPSRTVFNGHPHYKTNSTWKLEVGSVIIQCQLLAVRWRNVTSSHWKCSVKGQCWFEWSFCLRLCLMMDWVLPLQIKIRVFSSKVNVLRVLLNNMMENSKEAWIFIYWIIDSRTKKHFPSLSIIILLIKLYVGVLS